MEIIRGRIKTACKVVVYGPEGIGKSTFAAQFPDPLFIDTEGSTKHMDVARLQRPTSWTMLLEEIQYAKTNQVCKTLVIDTVDWAEQLCIEHICAKHHKNGIEDFGYGNGYIYVKEEMGRLLKQLEDLIDDGIHVVLTAHAQIRKFEQPDEMGAYDRYELKLGKKTGSQTSPLIKEWADMVLFANYKTFSVAVDDKGKIHKAQGGTRVMYTSHHPCWDAKNRFGLAEELPFEYAQIAHIFGSVQTASIPTMQSEEPRATTDRYFYHAASDCYWMIAKGDPLTGQIETSKEISLQEFTEGLAKQQGIASPPEPETSPPLKQSVPQSPNIPEAIPKPLRDLMEANEVEDWEIQYAVAQKGYYPNDVKVENYEPEFIEGCLVADWPHVLEMIQKTRQEGIPF